MNFTAFAAVCVSPLFSSRFVLVLVLISAHLLLPVRSEFFGSHDLLAWHVLELLNLGYPCLTPVIFLAHCAAYLNLVGMSSPSFCHLGFGLVGNLGLLDELPRTSLKLLGTIFFELFFIELFLLTAFCALSCSATLLLFPRTSCLGNLNLRHSWPAPDLHSWPALSTRLKLNELNPVCATISTATATHVPADPEPLLQFFYLERNRSGDPAPKPLIFCRASLLPRTK